MPTSQPRSKRKKLDDENEIVTDPEDKDGANIPFISKDETTTGTGNKDMESASTFITPKKMHTGPADADFDPKDCITPHPIGKQGLMTVFTCSDARVPSKHGFWPYITGLAKNREPRYDVS